MIAAAYLAALLWVDRGQPFLSRLAALWLPLAGVMALTLLCYAFRYARWRWLLQRQGNRFGWLRGFAAYLAGFAFTATPGKVGELLRIRYFSALGVPASHTFGTFVFERALDLLVILLLSLAVAMYVPAFGALAAIVLAFVTGLCVLSRLPRLQGRLETGMAALPGRWMRAAGELLTGGLGAMAPYWRPAPTAVGLGLGATAWLLTSVCFLGLCRALGLDLPLSGLGIYPLAMLVGALSFVPGGIGTTEAAVVLLLKAYGADNGTALTAAIGIRLATLWFAVVVGLLSAALLEISGSGTGTMGLVQARFSRLTQQEASAGHQRSPGEIAGNKSQSGGDVGERPLGGPPTVRRRCAKRDCTSG